MPRSCGNIPLQFQVLEASEDGHTSQIATVFRGFCLALVLTGCGPSHYNCASVTATSAQGKWVAVWVYPARLTIEGKAIAGYPRLLGDGLVDISLKLVMFPLESLANPDVSKWVFTGLL